MPEFGYDKRQHMKYDLGRKRYVEETLPYAVVREEWTGTLTEDNLTVIAHQTGSGKQLKLLFLRVWTEHTGGATFRITQEDGDVGSAPDGVVDYPFLEANGAEVIGPVGLDSPVHVLEGSVYVQITDPTSAAAGGDRFGVVMWGVEEDHP